MDPVQEFEKALSADASPQFQSALTKMFSNSYDLADIDARVGSEAVIAQQRQQAANAGKSNRVDEIKARLQEIQDKNDPAKYQKIKRQDGGFDFFNPKGEKIAPGEYAQVQGKSISDIFSDSDNLYEQQFRSDYESLNKLGQAWASGNTEEIKKILGVETDKDGKITFSDEGGKALYERLQKGEKFEDLSKQFLESYKDIFGGRNLGTAPEPAAPPVLSAPSPSIGDRFRGILSKIPGVNLESDPYR